MANYRYHCSVCFKTYIGKQLPGKMKCNCDPPKEIAGERLVTPLSDELLRVVKSSEAATLRNQLCTRWGIENKSHAVHGSNFAGNVTLANLIHNIVAPVKGDLYNTVRETIIRDYSYDIETKEMTC